MFFLPIEIWGKILVYLDSTQRIQVCKLLINSGNVKIDSCLFHTYMLLLNESKVKDNVHLLSDSYLE